MNSETKGLPPLSPSTLTGFLGCEYQTYLNMPTRREKLKAHKRPPRLKLLQERGERHEEGVLARIERDVSDVVTIEDAGFSVDQRALKTIAAMRAGHKVIYQGCLASDGWRGYPDFLIRVDDPTGTWDWSYEVFDAKLAKNPEPRHIYQLLFYTQELERIQGVRPDRMHLIVGSGETKTFEPGDFSAYAERIRSAFVERYQQLAAGAKPAYPYPVSACDFCEWWQFCEEKRRADDHLSLTAGLQRGQGFQLEGAGIHTVLMLAEARPSELEIGLKRETLAGLHAQAGLQVNSRGLERPLHELLRPEHDRGLGRLPAPSPGDVFFDFEGDPYWGDEGLEYLFGTVYRDDDDWEYLPIWGTDRGEERKATEQWIDWITGRLEKHPDLHIFHFNSYEPSALKALTQRHATREDELDQLLRRKVFVDLYSIAKQTARVGVESYGLKSIEAVYEYKRNRELDGIGSLWRWQNFQLDGERKWLDDLASYNEDDCRSTFELFKWLTARRPDAEAEFNLTLKSLEPLPEKESGDRARLVQERTDELHERLLAGLPDNESEDTDEQSILRLAFALVGYHRREQKPGWWEYFERLTKMPAELIEEDGDALAGLQLTETDLDAKTWEFRYPRQEHKMKPEGTATDPFTERSMTIDELDDRATRITVKMGRKKPEEPPTALVPTGPRRTEAQEDALFAFADRIDREGLDRAGPGLDLLMRRPPRLLGDAPPLKTGHVDMETLTEQVAALDRSALVVQGPPGTGKTYEGSHVAVRLMERGLKVGVSSNSHAAIENFLKACDEAADKTGRDFRGWHKGGGYESARISAVKEPTEDNLSQQLHAGTAWYWANADAEESVDVLFIDEAGQVSLADAIAVAQGTKNLVLLGDPQQLPHISQATHPFGAGESALEHMLGDSKTIPADRGVFLDKSWRMHPELCEFVSGTMYDGRLMAEPKCANQRVASTGLSGTGIRMIAITHEGNRSSSIEEAKVVAAEVQALLKDGVFTDRDGNESALSLDNILVVAPYNAQVRCLKEHLPDGARVGTVDKFQGQQAPVVIFSMASSSGDDVSRGLRFLLSSNRLNVAISRAQALAVVVCAPALLNVRCERVEDMKLVNLLCRVADEALGLNP